MSDTKSPPLNVWQGLKEAVVNPIVKDFQNAYWVQRAGRARYPAVDAALTFVPYVGVATNLDDLQRNAVDNGSFDIRDLGGLVLSAAATKLGAKGLSGLADGAGRARTASNVRVVGAGIPGAGYINHYIEAQDAANQKYGDRPLYEIARDLSR